MKKMLTTKGSWVCEFLEVVTVEIFARRLKVKFYVFILRMFLLQDMVESQILCFHFKDVSFFMVRVWLFFDL
jgi:hypothetical protein